MNHPYTTTYATLPKYIQKAYIMIGNLKADIIFVALSQQDEIVFFCKVTDTELYLSVIREPTKQILIAYSPQLIAIKNPVEVFYFVFQVNYEDIHCYMVANSQYMNPFKSSIVVLGIAFGSLTEVVAYANGSYIPDEITRARILIPLS